MTMIDMTPTWKRLSPLAIDKVKEFIPVNNGQAFVLEFIDALVKIEDQLHKKQGE